MDDDVMAIASDLWVEFHALSAKARDVLKLKYGTSSVYVHGPIDDMVKFMSDNGLKYEFITSLKPRHMVHL